TKRISDVDTTQTDDFQDLPDGWETPDGGGLHLITQMEVDRLGRTTALTDPNGNLTYTGYNDPNHETRGHPGWQAEKGPTAGPTQVWREDRGHDPSYVETLTMAATPDVDMDGRPTGTEDIADIQTLSRDYTSAGGQVFRHDAYFDLTGLTYSTDLYIGTQNTN